VVWRLDSQINVSKPTCKQLWKQLVVAKIEGQAGNVPADSPARRRLLELAKSVKSGDSSNHEAQAAKVYWSTWLSNLPLPPRGEGRGEGVRFHRDVDGKDAINAMLNYGYAVVRAAVGRALVAAGLHPALGLHHSNRSNAFCLADDLLEPLRPLVDRSVRELHQQGSDQLDRGAKAALLSVLTTTVRIAGQAGPLLVALHRMVASLVDCYEARETRLLIPRWSEEER
jgi:CRISPR-associated protein Cas1